MSNFKPYSQPLIQTQLRQPAINYAVNNDPSISSFSEPIQRQDDAEKTCADACWCWVKFVIIMNIIGLILGILIIFVF